MAAFSSVRELLLESLGRKVRLFSRADLEMRFFSDCSAPAQAAGRFLRNMASNGEVILTRVMLHPPIDVSEPIFSWKPGSGVPGFRRIASAARRRFQKPRVSTVVVMPGEKILPKSERRPLRASEYQHDSMLSSVFLNLIENDPSAFHRWTHEDDSPGGFADMAHIPDAVLLSEGGPTIIECIGSYSKDKITSLHEAYKSYSYQFF